LTISDVIELLFRASDPANDPPLETGTAVKSHNSRGVGVDAVQVVRVRSASHSTVFFSQKTSQQYFQPSDFSPSKQADAQNPTTKTT
jgi:hypothetical protein